jgi:hypothetical protein
MSLGIHDSNQSWFIDTLSSILAPNSSPTLVEIIIAYFPIHQLLHSAPPRIPDAVMSSLDTALSAHPSGPSIKWRLDCFETEFNDFAESVRLGMPRTSENGRLILETYAYHHMLSRIDELPYSP